MSNNPNFQQQTLEQYIKSMHTPQTTANYLFEIKNFLAVNPRAKRYKYNDMLKFLEELAAKHPNTATRQRILAAIKKYFDYLLQTGRRSDHPCRKLKIKQPKTAIQTQDLFSMEELQLLYNRPIDIKIWI